jgi:hypothetical protein
MTRYLLNSPILTSFGDWRYRGPVSVQQARDFVAEGDYVSAIGHAATAEYLQGILGAPVPCARRAVELLPGDRALVFQLIERLPEGLLLDTHALAQRLHVFGMLERLT